MGHECHRQRLRKRRQHALKSQQAPSAQDGTPRQNLPSLEAGFQSKGWEAARFAIACSAGELS